MEQQKQIKQLTPEQIKMLMRTAKGRNGGAATNNGRMERNAEQLYPLSKAQARLWFLAGFSEGQPLYNNPMSIRVNVLGELDLDLLRQALNDIADRHDILRTTFHLKNDEVMQHIHASCDVPVTYKDLRGIPAAERNEVTMREAREHGNFLFDISMLPLIRMHILRTADQEYIYLVNAHHLLTDGWTNAMLAMELPALYEARKNMVPAALPPVNRQFIDYVHYEQDWMKGPEYKAQVSFWKELFKEIPAPITHLSDYPRSVETSNRGAKFAIRIPAEQKQKILAYCKQKNITPFQYLINAFAIGIYRYSGHKDFVIGIPVANRNNIHFQNTFGPFLNTLPVPFHFSPGMLVSEFMAASCDVIQQVMKNQAVPFASLIEELNPPRDTQSNPLFQVHFAYQVFPQLSQEGALNFSPVDVDYHISKFDFNLWLEDDADNWLISVSYLTDLFRESSVRRLLERYVRLAGSLTDQQHIAIDRLNYVPADDLAVVGTAPLTEELQQRHWLHYFDNTCKEFYNNTALIDKNGLLTYGALNERAAQLACHLSSGGIIPGELVGVCVERNADMIVCMLALFKLGAAYLPIDPGTPADRLAFIIEDAGTRHVICSSITSNEFRQSGAHLFILDDLKDTPSQDHIPAILYEPESLAYVIYTSGTSGKPKGVKISHRSLINYTEAIWDRMKLAPGDSFANVSSLAADLGNTMIFPALAHGGILQIVPEECLADSWLMSDFFQKHAHDTLKIVPSHILALLDTDKALEILPKKLLILGGETCTVGLVKKIRQLAPSLRIINHYGPTEATIGSLTYEIQGNDDTWRLLNSIPIGTPLANTSVSVLDTYLQPVARGAYGEICLGGANLSLGYLNRGELEQERFIPDPAIASGRMYRTGDYGKILPDGNILYMGRMDRQVKIRGYRIELNEVEYTLNTCKGIKKAVILPPAEMHGQQGLTAVVCLENEASITTAWEDAARKLRSPMLPDKYIVVDKIPVTANGKVDYAQLSLLNASHTGSAKESVAPRDYIELELLDIWKQVLKVEDLSIDDDFFELGGHSLLAVKLLSHISDRFSIRLPLSVLFESNNIKQLARVLRSRPTSSYSPVVMLQPATVKNKLFVIHPAGGNVMSYYPLAKYLKNKWQVVGIQSADYAAQHDAGIPELSQYYLDEIIGSIHEDDTVVFAGWSMGALIAHNMACLFTEMTGRAPGLVIIDQPAPSGEDEGNVTNMDLADRLVIFGKKVSQLVGVDLGIDKEKMTAFDEQQRSQLFMDKFQEVGLMPDDVQLADFHGFLELMIRHNEITLDFQPAIFTGPSLVIKAGDRLLLPGIKDTDALRSADLGWGKWLPHCTVKMVPGNHVTIINQDNSAALSGAILSWAHSLTATILTT